MSLLTYNYRSKYLNGNTDVWIIMPDRKNDDTPLEFYSNNKKYKVLWLLHGSYGDHTDWVRKTNIERFATERDLIVVMPNGLSSNYLNWETFASGYNMYDYLLKELMPLVYNWLPASKQKEDNYIAGLSMGGFGALSYGLNNPELFNGIAVLSAAAVNPDIYEQSMDLREKNVLNNFKGLENYKNSYANTWEIFKKLAQEGNLPDIYVTIGTNDFFYKSYPGKRKLRGNIYRDFKNYAKELKANITFVEYEGYAHDWDFWEIAILDVLNYFKL